MDDKQQRADSGVLPSEAIFGFSAWLTSLENPVTFSCRHGAAIGAELAAAYNTSQGFDEVREDFHKRLKPYPAEPHAAEPVKVPSDDDFIREIIGTSQFAPAEHYANVEKRVRALLTRYGSKS